MPEKGRLEAMTLKNKRIMIQGTASTVGKSIICAALCRIFTADGYVVNPFKSQNMSLNSGITPDGLEMGRAQVMQAEAARRVPSARMNPILLKPTSNRKSQVVLCGKVYRDLDAVDYFAFKSQLVVDIKRIFAELAAESDIVVIEGAGSPAEINLNRDDFVNMGMAAIAAAPVLLVGDIDKGGVFAAIYGTVMLLNDTDRARIKGIIINKFRGSYELLEPGLRMLEERINIPVLGVIPYFDLNIEDEDSVTEWEKFSNSGEADLDIAVIKLPYMSNFTDFNPFLLYEDVRLRFVDNPDKLGCPDLIILPGSKSSIADLGYLRDTGMADRIVAGYRLGSYIFGVCGGYQMMGMEIGDSQAVESVCAKMEGLRLLETVTEFQAEKTTTVCEGWDRLFHSPLRGYEIHMGETRPLRADYQSLAVITERNGSKVTMGEGAISPDRRCYGTYIHGIFDNPRFTRDFLNLIRADKGLPPVNRYPEDYRKYKDRQYDELAEVVRRHLDLEKIYQIIGEA
jgi:adenosylcobyric acid synthase